MSSHKEMMNSRFLSKNKHH